MSDKVCERCKGVGRYFISKYQTNICPNCNGTGHIEPPKESQEKSLEQQISRVIQNALEVKKGETGIDIHYNGNKLAVGFLDLITQDRKDRECKILEEFAGKLTQKHIHIPDDSLDVFIRWNDITQLLQEFLSSKGKE